MPRAAERDRLQHSPGADGVVAQRLLEQIEVRTQNRRDDEHHEIDDDADERDDGPAAGEAISRAHRASTLRRFGVSVARKQLSTWSSTRPALCMKA